MALEVVALRPGGETELLNVVDVEMVTRRPGSESFLNISLSKGTYNYTCVQKDTSRLARLSARRPSSSVQYRGRTSPGALQIKHIIEMGFHLT